MADYFLKSSHFSLKKILQSQVKIDIALFFKSEIKCFGKHVDVLANTFVFHNLR